MHAVILVERHLPSSFFWSNLLKDKRIAELSVEEILSKYQGFEGELLSFVVFENERKLKEIIEQYLELKKSGAVFLLHILSGSQKITSSLKNQAFFVGYDIGVCDEEKTIYSSIFNEVLFGHLEELIPHKDLLNEHFLFPDKAVSEEYVNLHNALSAQGKSVEDYEPMTIYEIWRHKD